MGYLSHVGAACCEVSRPCFFCGSASLQSKDNSSMLKAETNEMGGIHDAFPFENPFCAHLCGTCCRHMVSCVRCRPLQRHPLHPRCHSRLFRAVHTLCGFRQLRCGAAGDRVSHQPLWASHAGGLAGWWQSSTSCAICFGTGYMDKAVFRNATSSKSAEHIAPRFSFYSIS